MTTREDIYEALFALVTPLLAPGAVNGSVDTAQPGVPTAQQPFNYVSRETIEVARVPPGLQPVLFMDEALEDYADAGPGLVHHKWTVYFHVGATSQKGTPAATILNPLIDAVEETLAPWEDIKTRLGLGDLIERAQFAGLSVKNLGDNSTDPSFRQAVAYLPFQIVFA